jgi:hypothetical protein
MLSKSKFQSGEGEWVVGRMEVDGWERMLFADLIRV